MAEKVLITTDYHLTRENYIDVFNALDTIIKNENPTHFIFLGDLFNSNRISAVSLLEIASEFKKLLSQYFTDDKIFLIPGNHDYYSEQINLLKIFGNWTIDKVKYLPNKRWLFIPFIHTTDVIDEIKYYFVKNNIDFIFTHYDLFNEHKYLSFLLDYDAKIISGHLHYLLRNKKYIYPGNFYFHNFTDANKKEAYYLIFDNNEVILKSHKLTPIFIKIEIDSPVDNIDELIKSQVPDIDNYKEYYVRFVLKIKNKADKKQFTNWMRTVLQRNNIDIQYKFDDSDITTSQSQYHFDLKEIINRVLQMVPADVDREILKVYIKKLLLYNDAANI